MEYNLDGKTYQFIRCSDHYHSGRTARIVRYLHRILQAVRGQAIHCSTCACPTDKDGKVLQEGWTNYHGDI